MQHQPWIATSIVFVLSSLGGCVVEEEDPTTATWDDRPSYEEWLEQWPQRYDGAYIVEGDIPVFSDAELRALYEHRYPSNQALTLDVTFWGNWNDWDPPTRYNLTYCVSNAFGALKPAVVDSLQYAAAGWEAAADIDFLYTPGQDWNCTNSNNNVVFNVVPYDAPSGEAANSFRPNYSRSERHIDVDTGPDGLSGAFNGMNTTARRRLMRHELGHALGFLHEFYNDEVDGASPCNGDDNGQVVSAQPDVYSIMMYSKASGCPEDPLGWLTDYDMMGAAYVYGPPLGYDVIAADFDGDRFQDLSTRFGRGGNWCIKFSSQDGVDGDWSWCGEIYGTSGGSTPSQHAVGDYDADGMADLSVKFDSTETWAIDYAGNGRGAWDIWYGGRGGSSATVTPADYDGDNRTDLSVRDSGGYWHIDYSSDGFGAWNIIKGGYGNNTYSVPVPGKYNNDNYADLAVKSTGSDGTWFIDYAVWVGVSHPDNGYGAWNTQPGGYGGWWATPVPSDYNGDGHLDLSVKDNSGTWYIDYWETGVGYNGWNVITPPIYGDSKWIPLPGKWREVDPSSLVKGDLAAKRVNDSNVVKQWAIDYRSNGYGNFPFDEYHDVLQ